MTIKYHFFGKDCLIDKPLQDHSNLNQALQNQGFKFDHETVFVNQKHTNQIVIIDSPDKIHPKTSRPQADAIVTNLKNLPIAIQTADCLPILLFDEEKGIIAAVHAGWRGAKSGIIENAIDAMISLDANIHNINAIIGPAIQQNSYQVSEDFYQDFLNEDKSNQIFFKKCSKDASKFLFNLPAYAIAKLEKKGIENITDSGIDTYHNANKFFSYRRSTHKNEIDCGRNISVIIIN